MVPAFERDARLVAPIIEEMFLGAVRRLRARLATETDMDTPVFVRGVRPVTVQQFLEGETYADAAIWTTFTYEGGTEPLVVALEGSLIARLVGPLLGQGNPDDTSTHEPRPVSPVELSIGSRLARRLVDTLEASWSVGVPPRFRPEQQAPSRRVCGDLEPSTPFAVCTVSVELAGAPVGSIFVGLPNSLVRRLVPRALGGTQERSAAPTPAPQRAAQFDRVMPVEVDVVVELARVQMPLRRLQSLRVGDEILLGSAGDATGRIGDLPVFSGEPGSSGGVRSVRIVQRMISGLSSGGTDR
ncbi:MAG: Flagellar motor switch protein FliM [Pseudomonadota bacterium]|jgi:flagellar motor switch protein FliM